MPATQAYTKDNPASTDWELENLTIELVMIARTEPFVHAHRLITQKVRQYIAAKGQSS
jgi:hypothetical protein